MSRDLRTLFAPESVCVIGASANPSSISGRPLRILRQHGFEGRLYPVNPKYETVQDMPCYPSVEALPGTPDVAILVLRADLVPDTLRECGKHGIRNAIIISSGFEEDDTAGALVADFRDAVETYGLNVVGPNSEGLWSVPQRAMMTFGSAAMRERIVEGPVSVISQSGSIGGNTARSLQERGIGCRYFISAGNETVLSTADYVDFLVDEGGSRVILLFLEGLVEGARFIQTARRARAAGVQIVALKAGSSEAGSAAAASHTGKITSAAAVYSHLFRQCGVLEVDSIGDLVDAGELLATPQLRLPAATAVPDGGIALVAPGATRTVMADVAERLGVPLATFSPETEAALGEIIPTYGYAKNPVDVTAQVSTAGMFDDVLQLMGSDTATEALVIQWGNRGLQRVDEIKETAAALRERIGKPVLVGFLGDRWELGGETRQRFREAGLACAPTPDEVLKQLGWLYRVREFDRQAAMVAADVPPAAQGQDLGQGWSQQARWLADCGFVVPAWVELRSDDSAAWQERLEAAGLRYPVAVKASPDSVDHKADLGLVELNVGSAAEVVAQARAMSERAPGVDAFLAQEMAPSGVEALVTFRRDPDFGALLTIGVGGELVELIEDVQHRALPISREELERAVDQTRLSLLLAGVRGKPAADREGLISAVLALAQRFQDAGDDVVELELNPVIVGRPGQGAAVVDVLVQTAGDSGTGAGGEDNQ